MSNEANIWQPRTILQTSADTKRITQRFTAVAGQTLFNITDFAYALGTGALEVYRQNSDLTKDGTRALIIGTEYVEQTDTSFALTKAAVAGEQIYAVAYIGITASVDVRDTDIFVTNYQAIRDYAGTEITLYSQGKVTAADGGESFFHKNTGAAPGFYVDNNDSVIVPTGGNGSIGWTRKADSITPTKTVATMKLLENLIAGFSVVETEEFSTGNSGSGVYDTVLAASVAPDEIDVIVSTANSLNALVLRVGASVELAQGGGKGGGFDNTAIFNKLQTRASTIILGSYTGVEVYTFATPPTLGSNLTTIVPRDGIFTGVTIQQLQGIQFDVGSIKAAGLPYIDEFRASGERVEIVQGTIEQQQAAAITITRSGSTATVTKVNHEYPNGARVVVKGATETEYNINATISNVTADTFDYTVSGTPATPATGSPTARNPARWDFINDASHEPIGVDDSTFITAVGSTIVIPFTKTYSKVLSFIVAPDNSLANAHNFTCGASVGLSSANIQAGASLHGTANILFDGANFDVSEGTGQVLNFKVDDAIPTKIVISHDYCPGVGVNMTGFSNNGSVTPHIPLFRAISNTSFDIQFQDAGTGALVGSLDTQMSFTINKMYHEGILLDGSTGSTGDSATLDLSVGNIWFYGEFVV